MPSFSQTAADAGFRRIDAGGDPVKVRDLETIAEDRTRRFGRVTAARIRPRDHVAELAVRVLVTLISEIALPDDAVLLPMLHRENEMIAFVYQARIGERADQRFAHLFSAFGRAKGRTARCPDRTDTQTNRPSSSMTSGRRRSRPVSSLTSGVGPNERSAYVFDMTSAR